MTTSTFNPGPVPQAITRGVLKKPAVLMSHGGRPGPLRAEIYISTWPSSRRPAAMPGAI